MAIKSSPTGVRFDLEKVEFIKQREKLKSNQQVVDFLLNKYWWEWKVPKATAKEAPPLYLKNEKDYVQDLPFIAPPKVVKVKTVQDYATEKRELECDEDYNKWLDQVENDTNLTYKQKQLLKSYA